MGRNRKGLIAALDVGTSKVCCLIARQGDGGLRVAGIGHQVSHGVRAGQVVDMIAAEMAIRAAVDNAERMAGENVREVFVGLIAGQPASHSAAVAVAVAGHEISENDLKRVLAHGCQQPLPDERQLIHAIPVGYSLDGARGIRDPRGMWGDELGVAMHLVSAAPGPVRNLMACVSRGHLDVAGLVLSPFAAGLSCLVEDEIELGVTVIEMGAGVTGIAVFQRGALVHVDAVPIGGQQITSDIARGLGTTLAHAERLKTMHGGVAPGAGDPSEMIDVLAVGENEEDHAANHVSRSLLLGIIRPRVEETLEMVRDRLADAGGDRLAGQRVVVTGGASQLAGMRDAVARCLGRQARLGRPIRVGGLAEATGGPAFAACAGILCAATADSADRRNVLAKTSRRRFAGLGRWLGANS
jgi:cell division protein FtsA